MISDPLTPTPRRAVALFVIAGLTLTAMLVFAFGEGKAWFKGTFSLRFESSSALRLAPGTQVKLRGLRIGKVSAITLNEQGVVEVVMKLEEDYRRFVVGGTRAYLSGSGLLGDAFIAIVPGDLAPGSVMLADNSVIPFDGGTSLDESLQQVKAKVFPVLDQMQLFSSQLVDKSGPVQGSFQKLDALLAKLHADSAQMDATLRSLNALAGQQMPQTLIKLQDSLQTFTDVAVRSERQLSELNGKLAVTVEKYGATSEEAGRAAKELQLFLVETRTQMRSTLTGLDGLVGNANQAVTNMRQRWPFSDQAETKNNAANKGEPLKTD